MNNILKENLILALRVAIKEQEQIEQHRGYQYESALLTGWRENLKSLEDGFKIQIIYS